MSPIKPHIFEFVLFDGFSNMVLASALEPLRDVKLRSIEAQVLFQVVTIDGEQVQSSSGLTVCPDGAFDPSSTKNKTLVFVAGYHVRDQATKSICADIRTASRQAQTIIALDTASWLLAAAGVLDGHTATIHWQELDAFKEAFPHVDASTARFVRSGPFISCGGASTALDMILDLINLWFGPAAAFEASNMFIYDPARQNEMGRGAERLKDKASPKLLAALDVMAEFIEAPLTTFELAQKVSMSERTLNRTFQKELGMTPGVYYRLFRLQRARHLIEETNLSQEEIAIRCGFSSGASLARSFQSAFGLSLTGYRS